MEYNLRLDPLCGDPNQIVKSKDDTKSNNLDQSELQQRVLPMIHRKDLVGRSFLLNEDENGKNFRAKIVKAKENHDNQVEKNRDNITFSASSTMTSMRISYHIMRFCTMYKG